MSAYLKYNLVLSAPNIWSEKMNIHENDPTFKSVFLVSFTIFYLHIENVGFYGLNISFTVCMCIVYSQGHFSMLIEDYNEENIQLNTLYVAFLDFVNLGGGYTKMQKKSKQDILLED